MTDRAAPCYQGGMFRNSSKCGPYALLTLLLALLTACSTTVLVGGDADGGGTDDGGGPDFGMDGDVPDMGGPDGGGDPDMVLPDGGGDPDSGPDQTPAPELFRTDPESPGNTGMPQVIGVSAPGAEVRLYPNGRCVGDPVETFVSMGDFAQVVSVEANRTTNLTADAVLPGAAVSECSNVLRYLWDATAPSTPIIEASVPESPSTEGIITLSGRADPGVRVVISFDGACGSDEVEVVAGEDGRWEVDVDVPFGDTTFSARAFDDVGNASPCSAPFVFSRVLDAEIIFPPAPGVTNLSEITVRARVEDVAPTDAVILESPAGRRAAIYNPDDDEWRAVVPLDDGAQVLSVSLAGVPGGATTELIDISRATIPRAPTNVIWDPAAMALLVSDGTRVLEIDPSTGAAVVRVEADASFASVTGLAVDGATVYLAGIESGTTGSILVASWDGMAITESARLDTFGIGPEHLDVRDGGDELIVYRTRDGVSVVDIATGATRTLVAGFSRCFTYSPAADEGVRCTGTTPPLETVDIDTGTRTGIGTLMGELPTFLAEARYDANGDRYVLRDFAGAFFGVDLDALTSDRLGSVASVEQFGVRGDTGGIVVTQQALGGEASSLVTLDPATGALGLIELLRVGGGIELGPPTAAAIEGQRAFVSDGARMLEVSLGPEGGNRTARVSGAGTDAWISTAFAPGTNRFFIVSGDGSLREGRLGGSTTLIAPGPGGFGVSLADVAVRPGSAMMTGEILEVNVRRGTIIARALDSVSTVRTVGTVDVGTTNGPIAVAFDGERDEVGVLTREGTATLRLTAFPVAGGGMGRVVATIDSTTALFNIARDLSYANQRYYVGNGPELLLLDSRSGTIRARTTFPGNLLQITSPGENGIGFAAMQNARGFAAFDAREGDWVIIGR